MRRAVAIVGSLLVTLTGSGAEPAWGADSICIVIVDVRPAFDTI